MKKQRYTKNEMMKQEIYKQRVEDGKESRIELID